MMTSNESLTLDQVISLVKDTMDSIDPAKLFYELKKKKVKFLRERSLEIARAAISLHILGLPINTTVLSCILDIDPQVIRSVMHTLGDKHVFTLKRGGYGSKGYGYEWIPNPAVLGDFISCLMEE